jgi:hypothetical protein
LSDACRDDRDQRSGQVAIVTGPNASLVCERDGVAQIHCLALRSTSILIHEHQFRSQAVHEQGIGNGRADVADANNSNSNRARIWRCTHVMLQGAPKMYDYPTLG